MCEVLDRVEQMGFDKGISKGQRLMIIKLIKEGILTLKEGADALEIPEEELKKEL